MNRLLWGIALWTLVAAGGWAQSTWRGQAEVWTDATAPAEGYVAASNEFPRNSLLSVENYKTHKTVQVRVVAALPDGSASWLLINPKAAAVLDMQAGDSPLVGVRLDPTGIDLAVNPDPDVNPLAPTPAPSPLASPGPAVALAPPVAPAAPVAAPGPEAPMPVPALAPSADDQPRTPLAVAEEPEPAAPVTPGKQVFVTTAETEPVATETPPVTEPSPVASPVPEVAAAPVPAPIPAAEPSPVPGASPAPVATPAPTPEVAVAPTPEPTPAPVAAAPVPVPAPAPAVPLAVKPLPGSAWVSVPGKLEGPVLGQVPVLASLEKGKTYVQVGSWATEAELLKVMGEVKSYVPLALYKAEGQKNPWRLVVASAPKGQLGVLLMLFRSEGYRTANVVKG